MKLTRDNSNSEEWPQKAILDTKPIEINILDNKEFIHKLILACGHNCFQTYDSTDTPYKTGDIIRCRTCFMEKNK